MRRFLSSYNTSNSCLTLFGAFFCYYAEKIGKERRYLSPFLALWVYFMFLLLLRGLRWFLGKKVPRVYGVVILIEGEVDMGFAAVFNAGGLAYGPQGIACAETVSDADRDIL